MESLVSNLTREFFQKKKKKKYFIFCDFAFEIPACQMYKFSNAIF